MVFDKEAAFEEAVITVLKQHGWDDAGGVLRYPTERDLINNWAKILFQNNADIDRLNGCPLTQGEMAQVIDSVTVLFPDEGIKTLSCADMAFGYRHSLLMEYPGAVVLHAEFALEKDDSAAIRSRMDDLMSRRRASQPLEYPSAGSTFKRPEGHFAGRLIEEAGCKGLTVGGAQVSEKHAGFVINVGGATCADVLALMAEVQRRVKERSGVTLEPEVRVVD